MSRTEAEERSWTEPAGHPRTGTEDLPWPEAGRRRQDQPVLEAVLAGEPAAAEEPVAEEPGVAQARSLLTELRPAGFGEVMVTDVWLPPPSEEPDDDEPRDPQREWETRQELRQLNLLRERPLVSHDARYEQYWGQVGEAMAEATHAIVDPYTALAATFAEAQVDEIAQHRAEVREYGRRSRALVALGRAYVAIGRAKSARSAFESAVKADPVDADAWWHLGVSRLFGRANPAAVTALQQAVEMAPADFDSELALAVAHYHAKDYAAAENHFSRIAGASGLRATARSMLACSQRMQGKWDDARVELRFLRDAHGADWPALADQCLSCVERGEQKRSGPWRARRRAGQMWRALAAAGASGTWIAYAVTQDLFRKETRWATLPLFVLAMLLIRALRGISGREMSGEFGNAEQGLPCWQATAWTRPRQSEF